MFFFFPSFDMWKEEGKRVSFFSIFFSIVEWLGRGGQGYIYIYMLKGDGRGRGFLFFYKFIMRGVEWGGVWREEEGEGG